MLLLLFKIRDDGYAMDSRPIKEVVPFLITQKISSVPEYVAGTVNYRGRRIPVIDLGTFLKNSPCRQLISTRIAIIHFPPNSPDQQLIGLLAESITGTVKTPSNWHPTPDKNGAILVEKDIVGPRVVEWFDPLLSLPDNIIEIFTLDSVNE